jgi:hypothetical protein
MCCHITKNWRAHPLVRQDMNGTLIANLTTTTGLGGEAALDPTRYEAGTKVLNDALAEVDAYPADFHGHDWHSLQPPTSKNR